MLREWRVGGKRGKAPMYSGRRAVIILTRTHTLHAVRPRRPLEFTEQVPSAHPCRYSNLGQSSP